MTLEEVPYFIKNRGCINCQVSKASQQKHGTPYRADHELVAGCLLFGCVDQGYSLHNPFMDPEEGMKWAEKSGNPRHIENIKKYCQIIKTKFGKSYEAIGVSLDKIMEQP